MRPRPDPERDESQWLDEDHFLEPVNAGSPIEPDTPVLKDARGRLWRVRRRPVSWTAVLAAVAAVILLALIAVVWLGA